MFGVDDAAAAAVIQAGASVLSAGGQVYAQGRMNRKTRKWNEKMYGIQKADTIANWHRQNAYNSPEQQMTRLRQAGLNPHLVYGKGADNTASSIQNTQPQSWNPQAPKIDLSGVGNSMSTYYDTKMKQANLDNVAQTIATMKAEENLKKITALNVAAQTDRTTYDLNFNKEMKDTIVQEMMLKNKTMETQIQVTLGKFDLEKLASADNHKKALQEIAESKARVLTQQLQNSLLPLQKRKIEQEIDSLKMIINNADLDRQMKHIELDLYKRGIQKNDPAWWRGIWNGLMGNQDETNAQNAQWKRTTYGGREGFDADGNKESQFSRMMKPNFYTK
jgi:hypothetical protein